MCTLIRYLRFMGPFILKYPSLLLSWMYEHDCVDTCCFGRLICMSFVFLYLPLFHMERRSRFFFFCLFVCLVFFFVCLRSPAISLGFTIFG